MLRMRRPLIGLPHIHHTLLMTVLLLLTFGIIMVGSSSLPLADFSSKYSNQPFYFVGRQIVYAGIGCIAALIVAYIPMKLWLHDRSSVALILIAIALLAVTLMFPAANGSKRWIYLGPLNLQTTEIVKLIAVLVTSNYVVQNSDQIRFEWKGFFLLCIPMGLILLLIMKQPDLGATVVILLTVLSIFFLAGAPLTQFLVMFSIAIGVIVYAVIEAPWRFERLLVILDGPWSYEFDKGYQLTRSLMALGHGEITGVGLGQSVFKLAHLPESHTDFIVAIVGEELGFIGLSMLILLEALLIFCVIYIGHKALLSKRLKEGYVAYGIACVFLLQTFVNIGMNLGLLPTKGLTLPLVSYGGSSLLITLVMIGLVYRIHVETLKKQNS